MRQLNLDQVQSLIEVIACGSFTAAAHTLNLTQPAVSRHLKVLRVSGVLSFRQNAQARIYRLEGPALRAGLESAGP